MKTAWYCRWRRLFLFESLLTISRLFINKKKVLFYLTQQGYARLQHPLHVVGESPEEVLLRPPQVGARQLDDGGRGVVWRNVVRVGRPVGQVDLEKNKILFYTSVMATTPDSHAGGLGFESQCCPTKVWIPNTSITRLQVAKMCQGSLPPKGGHVGWRTPKAEHPGWKKNIFTQLPAAVEAINDESSQKWRKKSVSFLMNYTSFLFLSGSVEKLSRKCHPG